MKKINFILTSFIIFCMIIISSVDNSYAQMQEKISIGLRGGGSVASVQFKANGLIISNGETLIRLSSDEIYTAKPIGRIYISDVNYMSISQEGILNDSKDFVYSDNLKEYKSASLTKKYPVVIDNAIGIYDTQNNLIFATSSKSSISFSSSDFEPVEVFGKKYRGGLKFINKGNALVTANYIDVEEYLLGVVPKEMSPSWSIEALKAQAVAARSFAYSNYNKYIYSGFNLTDDTRSQAYGGFSAEHPNTTKAVYDTKGIIGYYNGKVAQLIYTASSGGKTESSKNIWMSDIPYLRAQDDPHSIGNPYDNWTFTITPTEIENTLRGNGKNIGNLKSINIDEITSSGYVIKISFIGTSSTATYSKDSIRAIFGNTKIKSLKFKISSNGTSYTFTGSGYGHGIGMSQYGAKSMAEKGNNYRQIIGFYYPGVTLNQAY